MSEPEAEDARGADSRLERLAVRFTRWVLEHSPRTRRGRWIAFAAAFVLLTVPSLALLVVTLVVPREELESWFGPLGYAGVFVSNLLSTGTVFIPVPGLAAVGQALIISEAQVLSPFFVGIVAGLGMGLGETTAYFTGLVGAETARATDAQLPRRLQPLLLPVLRAVDWLMRHYWAPTLFVLSVIPDPIFEFAGITAGATRIGFVRFMAVVVSGNCIRGLLVAYYGDALIPFI